MLRKFIIAIVAGLALMAPALAVAQQTDAPKAETPKASVTYLIESERLTSTPCIMYKFATIESLFGKKDLNVDLVSFTDISESVDLGLGLVYYWKLAKNVTITTGVRFMNDAKGSIVVGYSLKL